jgi:hypothetical protein
MTVLGNGGASADRDCSLWSDAARGGSLPQTQLHGFTPYTSPFLNDRDVFSFVALNGIRE